jgi:hypothetical protein
VEKQERQRLLNFEEGTAFEVTDGALNIKLLPCDRASMTKPAGQIQPLIRLIRPQSHRRDTTLVSD